MTATAGNAVMESTQSGATAKVAAVIPAAGRARRFGSPENKIWTRVGGQTVLERTLGAFEAHPEIGVIVIVAGAEELERVRAAAVPFTKVGGVVAGGEIRAESVRNGLDALPAIYDVVLVHDAARPLVSSEVIGNVIEGVRRAGAAVPGLPLSDTVKRAGADGIVRATIPRAAEFGGETVSGLIAVQTPQGARTTLLRTAYASYDWTRGEPTDEASLLESFGEPVLIVPGDPANIKITRPEDVTHAERLLHVTESASSSILPSAVSLPEYRTGFGYDVHAFAAPEAGRKLFLGGVEIAHHRGLEGHSDADVLLHAVCDALLGASSLGDIGILFPNTDPTYRGISSLKLLAHVGTKVREAGWEVVNLDIAVVAEAPKLMPHRTAMQATIAGELGLDAGRVSVKATTNEKMGFVGRQEGIAAWAVATVRSHQRSR